jgi:crotonobetainyl-CoA:carnitine CoA-transferase CaiB-like acyl-CoA transferase
MTDATRAKPLAGIRVLELGRLIAAPFCGQILGDLGADVIKVERAGTGDDVRGYGPPFLPDKQNGQSSVYYLAFNRNKRSIAIDFAKPGGADLIRNLAGMSDVFIENFKVGSLARYGLDEASLRAANPDLIYLSVSGFGQNGPYATRPATDVIIQGMTGLMNETGDPEASPNKVGVPIADMVTGLYGALTVVSSLLAAERSGRKGSWSGVSLLDCCMAVMGSSVVWNQLSGSPPMRSGNEAQGSSPSGIFTCSDGDVLLQAGKDADFVKLCQLLKLDALIDDPKFRRRDLRVQHNEELRGILAATLSQWSREEFFSQGARAGIICGPINRIDQALADPQVVVNEIAQSAGHPDEPGLHLVGSPMRFGESEPVAIGRHPPRLGEHTFEVLREMLDLSENAIDRLAAERVIQVRPGGGIEAEVDADDQRLRADQRTS